MRFAFLSVYSGESIFFLYQETKHYYQLIIIIILCYIVVFTYTTFAVHTLCIIIKHLRIYVSLFLPFPNIRERLSMKYWSSLTAERSPLTKTCHSACAFPLNTIRTAENNQINTFILFIIYFYKYE